MATMCTECSAVLPAEARFCLRCGTEVDARPRCVCGEPWIGAGRFCSACGRAAAAAEPVEPQAERRLVTVLFADAVGSTAFAERAGDEAAYRFVQDCVALMSAAVERHGGTITQFRGDGIMALFGAPVAYEDSAVRAATAALEMRDSLAALATSSACSFRIGLSTGPVVVGRVGDDVLMDYTAIGDTANVAARMEAAAQPGTVYLADTTWRAVRQYVECTPIGELEVKGKAQPVTAHEAIGRRAVRTRLQAAVERGLGRFVGRSREVELLVAHVDALAEGHGHVVEITGEPGIGKSRLLLELRERVPEGVGWMEGACSPSGVDTPYLPIADLLRNAFSISENDDPEGITARIDAATATWSRSAAEMVPYLKYLLAVDPGDEVVVAVDARTRRARIVDALRTSLVDAARRQPRILVIEDVHWADEASREALRALAELTATEPILLVATSRPGRASPFDGGSSHSRIALDGITEEATRAMVASALAVDRVPDDVAALVARRAEGNPLFVEELAAMLVETGLLVREHDQLRLAAPAEALDVPGTLQELILARIDRLAREAREALQLAAVIGREFTVRLLDRLATLPHGLDVALDELKSVELIRQKSWFPELAYLFKHALTHEVTYATLLDERRRALHRLVAQAIEEVYADRIGEHVESLAHHWLIAEEWERALDYLERSGDGAAATFANGAAVLFYEEALEVAERVGATARATSICQRLGDVRMVTGDLPAAADVFARMATIAEAGRDHDALAWALAYRGEALAYLHDWQRAEPLIATAAEMERANAAPRLYAAVFLKTGRYIFGHHEESAAVDPVIASLRSEPVDHPRVVAGDRMVEGLLTRWQGDLPRCLEVLDLGSPAGADLLVTQQITWTRAICLAELGRYDEALATVERSIDRSVEAGELMFRARNYNTMGWVRLDLGDHTGSIEWNERCLAYLHSINIPDEEIESNARLNLAETYLSTGRLDLAAAQLERVQEMTGALSLRGTWMLWRYRQRLLLLQSALDVARGQARSDSRIDDAVALAEASNSRKYVGKAGRLRGRIALARGRLDEAEAEALAALDVAAAVGHPPERWRSLALLGDVAQALGDADLAHERRGAADALLAEVEAGLADPACRTGVAALRSSLG